MASENHDPEIREAAAALAMLAVSALPGIGVLVFDADLRYVLCGGEVLGGLGYSPAGMVGRTLFDLVPEHPARELEPAYRDALRGRTGRVRVEALEGGRSWDVEVVSLPGGYGMAVFSEVTAELEREAERQRLAKQFGTAFDDSAIGTAIVAPEGTLLRVNEAMARLLGYEVQTLQGMTFQGITHPDDLHADLALLDETLAGKRDHYELEKRYLRADGSTVWILLSVSALRETSGAVVHLISHVQDISQRRALEQRLTHMAEHDVMTGLINRATFDRRTSDLHASSPDAAHCIVILDVDDFKTVNDTMGHQVGDSVLRHVADTLARLARPGDIVARYGGDEFVVCLPHMSFEAGETFARSVCSAVAAPEVSADGGLSVSVRASVGVGVMDDTIDASGALRAADAAMYHAKRVHKRESTSTPRSSYRRPSD